MIELRCPAKKHGMVVEWGVVEVKCDSYFCRHEPDEIVLHRFRVADGALIETLRFRNPKKG